MQIYTVANNNLLFIQYYACLCLCIIELIPEIMHELIEQIVVHKPDKSNGHRTQEIEIHYRFNVAVMTAITDSMQYGKKRKAA